MQAAAKAAEHSAVMHGLGRGDRCIGIAHCRVGNRATFDDQRGLHAEEGGLPNHDVGPFTYF